MYKTAVQNFYAVVSMKWHAVSNVYHMEFVHFSLNRMERHKTINYFNNVNNIISDFTYALLNSVVYFFTTLNY